MVDETGRDDEPFRVEHDACPIGFDPVGVEAHDAISADRDIGRKALGTKRPRQCRS